MLIPVNAETVHKLGDGVAGQIINASIRAAIGDLEDRGHKDGKPRRVTITLDFLMWNEKPYVSVDSKFTPPPYKSASTFTQFKKSADTPDVGLVFEEHNAENPEQPTFFDGPPKLAEGEVENE